MIDVTRDRITISEYRSSQYDIDIFDRENDYEGQIKEEDIDDYIECLQRMFNKHTGTSKEPVRTDKYIDLYCKDLLNSYRGNWIILSRIPTIINVLEEFKAENGLGRFNKENILKNIDNIELSRLHKLVQVIKRKEKANETSRN